MDVTNKIVDYLPEFDLKDLWKKYYNKHNHSKNNKKNIKSKENITLLDYIDIKGILSHIIKENLK